jgi:hypothetical protein
MHSSIHHFNDFVNTIPSQNTINYLYHALGRMGVNVIYEKSKKFDKNLPVYDRLMFGTFNRTCSFEFPGVIMSKKENSNIYQAISVPPPPPVTQYDFMFLQNNFNNNKNINIINANDGTTVTIYYFNCRWVISTHRGFEVNSYIWVSNKTYQDVINSVLNNYPEFNYDKLDKSKSYTFGFNQVDFHPFREGFDYKEQKKNIDEKIKPSSRAWFIQSVDLKKFNESDLSYVSYTEDIGLPIQKNINIKSLKTMFINSNNAYNDYIRYGTINYGYIIKIGLRQYLIESTLLKNIRHIFYSKKFNSLNKKIDKRKYITVNSFLDSSKYSIFIKLFPLYNTEFILLQQKMDLIANTIIKIVYITKKCGVFKPDNIIDNTAQYLHIQLTKTITLNNYNKKDAINLIYTFIYDVKFTDLLYKIMYG